MLKDHSLKVQSRRPVIIQKQFRNGNTANVGDVTWPLGRHPVGRPNNIEICNNNQYVKIKTKLKNNNIKNVAETLALKGNALRAN